MELANRLDRLWAKIIDHLFVVLVGTGAAIAIPALRGSGYMAAIIVIGAVALIAFVGVQIWLLTTCGQTVGKRIMGLRIVKVKDMANGGFVINVLMRGVVGAVITAVPVAGVLYGLADPLCIFREDRRCLHDHIAGTCVIKA